MFVTIVCKVWFWFGFMVFNATFNNVSVISWRSVLLVEETGGPGENHRPVASMGDWGNTSRRQKSTSYFPYIMYNTK
jgi:hypothetical protein